LYRRLADLRDDQAIEDMRAELTDRFGPLPEAIRGLLFQLKVKLRASRASVTAISSEDSQISIRLPYLAEVDRSALQHYLGNGVRVSRTSVWLPREQDDKVWQARLLNVLDKLENNSGAVTAQQAASASAS
jgi:transcription-repair coupling factor (superfamily II helicase)